MNNSAMLFKNNHVYPLINQKIEAQETQNTPVNPEVLVGHAYFSALTIDNLLLHSTGNDVEAMMD